MENLVNRHFFPLSGKKNKIKIGCFQAIATNVLNICMPCTPSKTHGIESFSDQAPRRILQTDPINYHLLVIWK